MKFKATLEFDNKIINVDNPMYLIQRDKNAKLTISELQFEHGEDFTIVYNNMSYYKSDIIVVDYDPKSKYENSEFIRDIENKIINGECSVSYLYKTINWDKKLKERRLRE